MSAPNTPLVDQVRSADRRSLVELAAKDLNPQGGVFCPSPVADMKLWNTHPKVYLDVGRAGEAKCPYCGTVYRLKAGEHFGGGH
ncbi:MAG: zinc-finger domain-containing protein [Comamonadaceae bacterium]|nr:MAG: zinc-finger domain-containing protein [Comamonadaceae bacterium]